MMGYYIIRQVRYKKDSQEETAFVPVAVVEKFEYILSGILSDFEMFKNSSDIFFTCAIHDVDIPSNNLVKVDNSIYLIKNNMVHIDSSTFRELHFLYFDIDYVGSEDLANQIVNYLIEYFKIDDNTDFFANLSGKGIHFGIRIMPITKEEFEKYREPYKESIKILESYLRQHLILPKKFCIDSQPWMLPGKLRVPGFINTKDKTTVRILKFQYDENHIPKHITFYLYSCAYIDVSKNTVKTDNDLLRIIAEKIKSVSKIVKINNAKNKIILSCPFHDDQHPSAFIYQYDGNYYFYCSVCRDGRKMSVYNLLKQFNIDAPELSQVGTMDCMLNNINNIAKYIKDAFGFVMAGRNAFFSEKRKIQITVDKLLSSLSSRHYVDIYKMKEFHYLFSKHRKYKRVVTLYNDGNLIEWRGEMVALLKNCLDDIVYFLDKLCEQVDIGKHYSESKERIITLLIMFLRKEIEIKTETGKGKCRLYYLLKNVDPSWFNSSKYYRIGTDEDIFVEQVGNQNNYGLLFTYSEFLTYFASDIRLQSSVPSAWRLSQLINEYKIGEFVRRRILGKQYPSIVFIHPTILKEILNIPDKEQVDVVQGNGELSKLAGDVFKE